MRRFNVTGLCMPEDHYMVDISGKIAQIRKLIDNRSYFTISRARQYGKTTTLFQLERALRNDYIVASLSFENIGEENFSSAEFFCGTFVGLIQDTIDTSYVSEKELKYKIDAETASFQKLSRYITEICRDKKIVLMIDEVDKTSNNRIYLHFLAMLRDKFLARKARKDYTFHSVILAGVYDVRNIKLKIINEGFYEPAAAEGKIYNSPWNIAVNFNVDMSFTPSEISTMLSDYESDCKTGMDTTEISEEIYNYTSGYPFLVSRICQCIDEEIDKDWTIQGVQTAVGIILREKNTLFDDIAKNLENSKELYSLIYDVLITGKRRTFTLTNPTVNLAYMYGIIKESERGIQIFNRIFELIICEYFISKDEEAAQSRITGVVQQDVVQDGRFDMELCFVKFAQHYAQIYNEIDVKFIEREGRLLFLTYLRPLINGQGFYHIESRFTDSRRMDIVVDFAGEQFVIELKLWKGEATHEKAYGQLAGYLESKGMQTGYLLTFDFRKDASKETCAEWVEYETTDGYRVKIFDVVV